MVAVPELADDLGVVGDVNVVAELVEEVDEDEEGVLGDADLAGDEAADYLVEESFVTAAYCCCGRRGAG